MTDKIYLLSIEEYEKYKNVIPRINSWWWLRSPGYGSFSIAIVNSVGSVDDFGYFVDRDIYGVRPALCLESDDLPIIGTRKNYFDFPWVLIDKDLWIAEVPVGFWRFDEKSNDYEKSEIRKKLIEWYDSRYEE